MCSMRHHRPVCITADVTHHTFRHSPHCWLAAWGGGGGSFFDPGSSQSQKNLSKKKCRAARVTSKIRAWLAGAILQLLARLPIAGLLWLQFPEPPRTSGVSLLGPAQLLVPGTPTPSGATRCAPEHTWQRRFLGTSCNGTHCASLVCPQGNACSCSCGCTPCSCSELHLPCRWACAAFKKRDPFSKTFLAAGS